MKTISSFILSLLIITAAGLQAQVPPDYNPSDVTFGIQSGNTYDVTTRDGKEHFGIIYNNTDKDGVSTITTFSPDMSSMTTTRILPGGGSVTTSLGN
jgi:hypothetical protein